MITHVTIRGLNRHEVLRTVDTRTWYFGSLRNRNQDGEG